MQVRPFAPLAVTMLAIISIPFHHLLHEARPLDQAAVVVSYPQRSSTGVDNGDTLDILRQKIRASRSMNRQSVAKPTHVVHPNVHVFVSRETPHVVRPHPRTLVSSSAEAWAHQYFSIRVANCESGGGPSDHHTYYDGNPHLSDPNGHYGKWQFAPSTWYSVGGTGNPAYASEAEQDYRAWVLWKRDGWGQWECASMV